MTDVAADVSVVMPMKQFEPTESTRQAMDDGDLRATGKKSGDRLFTGRGVISAIH